MRLERSFIKDVIHVWSGSRRFLQDDPVRPDVRIAFAEAAGRSQDPPLEPRFSMRPGAVGAGSRSVLRPGERTDATAAPESFGPNGDGTAVPDRALLRRDPESLLNGRRLDGCTHEVLTLARVVGLLAFAALAPADDRGLFEAHRDRGDGEFEAAFLDRLCGCIADGWERMFGNRLPTRADDGCRRIHSVTLDRPAALAVHRSALTITADAARLLVTIDRSEITGAVVDAGIDATHPAFGHGRPTASLNGGTRFRTVRDESHDEGYCAISIIDPGNAESVITVGSTHRFEPHSYGVGCFSSRGPTGLGRERSFQGHGPVDVLRALQSV